MDRFYASWPDGKRAKARKLHKLTGFVQFCLKRKWMVEDISSDLEPPEGHSIPANKSPFTDDEINRIIAACDKIGGAVGQLTRPQPVTQAKPLHTTPSSAPEHADLIQSGRMYMRVGPSRSPRNLWVHILRSQMKSYGSLAYLCILVRQHPGDGIAAQFLRMRIEGDVLWGVVHARRRQSILHGV